MPSRTNRTTLCPEGETIFVYSHRGRFNTQLGKMSIDPDFIELTADAFVYIYIHFFLF